MGCGCSSGGNSNVSLKQLNVADASSHIICDYTMEQVDEWLVRVNCFKEKGLWSTTTITKKQINRYIGTLTAAKKYVNNICFFKQRLAEVENFMIVLTSIDQC